MEIYIWNISFSFLTILTFTRPLLNLLYFPNFSKLCINSGNIEAPQPFFTLQDNYKYAL